MGVDLTKLDYMLDEALNKETTESLNRWLDAKEPLFTLTAEEVEQLTPIFSRLLGVKLYDFVSFLPDELPTETIENLLTRIKQWQDECDNSK